MNYAFATWNIKGHSLPDDLQDIHISCGVGDDQWDGLDLNKPESKLIITGAIDGYDMAS